MFLNLFILILLIYSSLAFAVQEGQAVPDCAATLSSSKEVLKFNTYKGKVLLVDFWATWCPPCQKSMPFFNKLRNELLNQGFEIIAINVDEDKEEAVRFLKDKPVDYMTAFDPNGDCPKIFEVKAMPSSYFIDKSGKVRSIHLGYRDSDQDKIREQLSSLLSE